MPSKGGVKGKPEIFRLSFQQAVSVQGENVESYDVIIAGAGVIGLAVGARFAEAGASVLVLEREAQAGSGVSSRNSGVIHAGIYYPTGSLKAQLCVRGNVLLYEFCKQMGVPHARLGKWIVATSSDEMPRLEALLRQGQANGVPDLIIEDDIAVARSEPALKTVGGLWSPSSGIVDVHALILALEGRLQHFGGMLVCGAPVASVRQTPDGFDVTAGESDTTTLRCRLFINSAGLGAHRVASAVDGLDDRFIPPRFLSKGHYFTYRGASPFRRLVYPVPEQGGLGIHATLDTGGQLRFGPDVEAVSGESYDVTPVRTNDFVGSIRRYFPDVDPSRLIPDFAGIRPKIVPADSVTDFLISGPDHHGMTGLYNLYGMESPGLTCSLAIAEKIHHEIKDLQLLS